MRGSISAKHIQGNALCFLPLASLTATKSEPVSPPHSGDRRMWIKHPAIRLTKLGFLPQRYDFGEAAGLAFSFFVPFSALAAFTSTSLAVMV
jgi:hypothetical protein